MSLVFVSERTPALRPAAVAPPAEVRVLVLNGTNTTGAAGRTADDLRLNRGYDTLTPGNALEDGGSLTAVYYVDGYELDARQIAQILNAGPEAVQPLPDGVLPPDTEGEPHVVVVLGEDLVG